MGAYTAHNEPADFVEYQNLGKVSGEHLDPEGNHPQHVASNSPDLRCVMPDEMATHPNSARFSSLYSIGDIPQQQPKY